MSRGSRKVDLAEIRRAAEENGDTRLSRMSNRELRATVLENYLPDQEDRETVVRTRAAEAQHRARERGN